MVLIEAQANGLPCIASTEVPRIARVSDKISFINLDDQMEIWVNTIIKYLNNIDRYKINFTNEINKYDIKKRGKKN